MVRNPKMPKGKPSTEEKTKEVWDKVFEIQYCTPQWFEAKTKKPVLGRKRKFCKRNKIGVCCIHCRFKEKCKKMCTRSSQKTCKDRYPRSEIETVFDTMTTINVHFFRRMCVMLRRRKDKEPEWFV